MQKAIELVVENQTLRGMEHIPTGDMPTSHMPIGHTRKLPAAILFHGYTGTKVEPHRIFVKISRALEAAGIASFRFDFSGSGESDGDFENMTLTGEVKEAHAILDFVRGDERIDENRVILIGLSMGGLVASLVAGERPKDVHQLILLAPAGNMRDIVLGIAEQSGIGHGNIPDTFDDNGNLVGKNFVLDLLQLDSYQRAAGYSGEVLLIHGTNDGTVNVKASYDYQTRSYDGNATLQIIEGADHTFNKYEWEQNVIQTILGFVKL